MSYEGYIQCLCKEGHMFEMDCYSSGENDRCPYCQSEVVFRNGVDDTNCEAMGIIRDWNSLLIEEVKKETCPHCKHTTVVGIPKYRIPTEDELNKLLCYFNQELQEYRPLSKYDEDLNLQHNENNSCDSCDSY